MQSVRTVVRTLIAVFLATAAPVLAAPAVRAHAQEVHQQSFRTNSAGSGRLTISVDGVSPSYATPTATITVRGTVTNDTGSPVTGVQVQLLSSSEFFGTRSAMDSYSAGHDTLLYLAPEGTAVTLPGTLHSGRTAHWSASFTSASVGYPQFGVSLEEEGVIPEAVAGLSVGAFAAAVHARVLALADCVRLVKQRAELMEKDSPDSYGLAAIIGLTEAQVVNLIQQANTADDPVYLGNVNAPEQIVISGSSKGLEKVSTAALKAGARKAELLNVPVLSHSPLLLPVADALTQALQNIQLHSPRMVYVSNVRARTLRTAAEIACDLANNIAHGVRWYDATTVLQELGCNLFVEMPPGHVLTNLAKQSIPQVRCIALAENSLSYIVRKILKPWPMQ
jgi:malonate decarboxylase epsilon subunit